jgi:hypothetical protein
MATCFTTKNTKGFHKEHKEIFVSACPCKGVVLACVPFVVNSLKQPVSDF